MISILDPSSSGSICARVDVCHASRFTHGSCPVLFLSICSMGPNIDVAADIATITDQEAMATLQDQAKSHGCYVVLVLVTMADGKELQEALDTFELRKETGEMNRLDLLIISKDAQEQHLPALARRQHLFFKEQEVQPSSAVEQIG